MSGLRETSERRLAQPISWRRFLYGARRALPGSWEKDTRAVCAASPVLGELFAVSEPYESDECRRGKPWLKEER
jgi:hypothetical protein